MGILGQRTPALSHAGLGADPSAQAAGHPP